MKTRIIALLCALFMLLPSAIACAEPTGTESSSELANTTASPNNGDPDSTTPTATEETAELYPAPEIKDLNKFTYRVFVVGNDMWGPVFFSENGEDGTYINDALYRRETLIEEKYNCNIEYVVDSNLKTTLSNNVTSGTVFAEAIHLSGKDSMASAKNGYLLDINTLEGLQLESPWWDQRIQEEYLIGSHLFTLEGDMNMLDELRTTGIVYNKRIYGDKNFNSLYGTPYELVANQKWTLENMLTMIEGVTTDPTDDSGTWGMLSEVSGPYYFFLGLGEKTLNNKGGEFQLNIGSESVSNALQYTTQLVKNPDVMIVNNGSHFGNQDVWGNATKLFLSGNVLFRSTALSAVNGLTEMSDDYGLLPIPNAGGSDEYYCYVSGSNHRPLTFPANLEDIEKTLIVSEATAYYGSVSPNSNPSLREAFYYLLADYRLARSPEDTEMLDIIFDSKTFDVDQAADVTGLESTVWSLCKAGTVDGIASTIASINITSQKSVESLLKALESKYGN